MIEPLELLGALLGAIFVALGAGAALLSRLRTASVDAAMLSFGAFVGLYGARLLVRSEVVRQALDLSAPAAVGLDAAITYWILVPMGALFEALLGRGRWGMLRRAWQVTAVFAAAAVVWDLANTPGAALVLNPIAVFANMSIGIAHLLPRLRDVQWTVEGRALAVAAALFTVVAVYETLFGTRLYVMNLEPAAMLVLVTALGVFVAARLFGGERLLAAVRQELETARQIQQSLLPRSLPTAPGLRLAAQYVPAGVVAGDIYDVIVVPEGGLTVLVADVSGHGVPAAIIASMVKAVFSAEAGNARDPARVLAGMNRALYGKFERAFVTAVCAHVEAGGRRLRYASAGHPSPLVLRATGCIDSLDERGILMGFTPAALYTSAEATLEAGDSVIFCTDGLLEAERDGVLFGEGELQRQLARTKEPADVLAGELVRTARAWAGRGTEPLDDDLTVVVLDIE